MRQISAFAQESGEPGPADGPLLSMPSVRDGHSCVPWLMACIFNFSETLLINVGFWCQSSDCLTPATQGIWQLQSLSQWKNWHFFKVLAAVTYSAAPWFVPGVLPDSLRFICKSGVTWLCWQKRLMVETRYLAAALELWFAECNLLPSGRLQSMQA